MNKLSVESTPHIRSRSSVSGMMLCVIAALLPAVIAGVLYYGKNAALILLTTVGSAFLLELIGSLIIRRKQSVHDLSAVVTGLILGMLLPPDLALWKASLGSFIAIILVKQMFGGIGRNFANPAAVAWIAMRLIFAKDMTTWRVPDTGAITRVTPLVSGGTGYWDLLLGNYASYIGTGCAAALLLGMIFLCFSGIISPAAPVAFLGSFALLTWIGGYDILSQLLTGSLVLAACFMACDYTTTPFTVSGKLLFGLGCGILTFLIRHYGGFAEGAVFAIVLMNLLTPAINRITRKHPFGAVEHKKDRKKKKPEAESVAV